MRKACLIFFLLIAIKAMSVTYFDIGSYVVKESTESKNSIYNSEIILDDKKEIEVRDFDDILKDIPFVDYTLGSKSSSFRIDGFNDYQYSVLMDGATVYNVYDNYLDLTEIPVSNIEKVSIERGISSLLAGPDSFGAAISIKTRKPRFTERNRFNIRIGENNSRFLQYIFEGKNDNQAYNIDFYKDTSGGYSVSKDFTPNVHEDGGLRDNSDYNKSSFNIYYGKKISGNDLGVRITRIENERGLPGDTDGRRAGRRFWRYTEWEKTQYSLNFIDKGNKKRVEYILYKDLYYNVLDAYDDNTYSTQNAGRAFHSIYDDNSTGIKIVPEYKMKDFDLSLLLYYKDDKHEEQDDTGLAWDEFSAKTSSFASIFDFRKGFKIGFARSRKKIDENSMGINREAFEDTDYSLEYRLAENIFIDASLKHRFPTIKEMFSGYLGVNQPNPNLETEKAKIIGINFKGSTKNIEWSSRIFYNNIEDQIDDVVIGVDPLSGDDIEQNQNVGEFRYTGISFDIDHKIDNLSNLELLITYTDPKDKTNVTTDKVENYPKKKVVLSYKKDVGNNSIHLKQNYVSDSEQIYDITGKWQKIPSYSTTDIFYKYNTFNAGKNKDFYINVKNIFDKDYYTSIGRPEKGRSIEIGQNISF